MIKQIIDIANLDLSIYMRESLGQENNNGSHNSFPSPIPMSWLREERVGCSQRDKCDSVSHTKSRFAEKDSWTRIFPGLWKRPQGEQKPPLHHSRLDLFFFFRLLLYA
jgi:hypothetical protein